MKIITFYLPQFHICPENDKWWGKGFTEWTNVKKAKPLFKGHNQPRIPLHENYYNLLTDEIKEQQVAWAKQYGIYGFCFYHYWFNGHLLLEKPVEQYLKSKKLDLPFCLCWANENWTNAWANGDNKILIEQHYGDKEEWKKHFEYMLPFFKDSRYIKENGKPLLVIYRPDIMKHQDEILQYWNELAKNNSFEGMIYVSQNARLEDIKEQEKNFEYHIEYQPKFAARWMESKAFSIVRKIKQSITKQIDILTGKKYFETYYFEPKLKKWDYDKYWNTILTHMPDNHKYLPGAFVDWDNTPRKGTKGSVCVGATPEKFYRYLKALIMRTKEIYKKEYLFLFAWNEWAEGGYLEPDDKYKFGYLEAVKRALEECGEFPNVEKNKNIKLNK